MRNQDRGQQSGVTRGNNLRALATSALVTTLVVVPLAIGTVAHAQEQATIGGASGKASERTPPSVPGGRGGDLFEPLGLKRGAFLINPYLSVELGHDDNVFADNTNRQSDSYLLLRPGFSASSLWSRHSLRLFGDITSVNFSDIGSEDYDGWNLGASGRVDVDRMRFISLGAQIGESATGRDALNEPDLPEPSSSDYSQLNAGWYHEFNRLYYRLGATWNDEDYKSVNVGGVTFSNDDRDYSRTVLTGEVGYEFMADYLGFVQVDVESTDYNAAVDDLGVNRDSDGSSVLLGVIVDKEDLLTGRVYLGHRERDYDDINSSKVSGGVVGAGLTWRPTGLTTVSLDVDRGIEDANGTDAAGLISSNIDLRAEHELRRNVLLNASLGWFDDDYKGIDRSEDGFEWSIGGEYLANRWLRLGASYTRNDRDSSGADRDESSSYDRDVIRLYVELIR